MPHESDIFLDRWFDASIGRLWDMTKAKGKETMRTTSQRRLVSQLGQIFETAENHRLNGVKHGDDRYKALRNTARKSITEFCARWQADQTDLEAQLPGLAMLDLYAVAPVIQAKPALAIGTVLLLIVSPVLLGLGVRILQFCYHLGADRLAGILHLAAP